MAEHEHHGHAAQHEHGSAGHHGAHHHGQQKKRPLHHDWRLWAAVVLMLAAMAAYLLSFDEEFAPGGTGEKVPAAPAPAAGP